MITPVFTLTRLFNIRATDLHGDEPSAEDGDARLDHELQKGPHVEHKVLPPHGETQVIHTSAKHHPKTKASASRSTPPSSVKKRAKRWRLSSQSWSRTSPESVATMPTNTGRPCSNGHTTGTLAGVRSARTGSVAGQGASKALTLNCDVPGLNLAAIRQVRRGDNGFQHRHGQEGGR
jgi:hypothetical protein